MHSIHASLARQGITRSSTERVLAGVCGGLAEKLGINAWAMRALIIASMLVLPGSQIILYPIAWILMPEDTYLQTHGEVSGTGPQDRINP